MNIFILDYDHKLNAKYHVDKHVVKMPLELAQLMSTTHRILDGGQAHKDLYKVTHYNHPCARWVRASSSNYQWTYDLWLELNWEYSRRFKNTHGVLKLGNILRNLPRNIEKGDMTPFAIACGEDRLDSDDACECYRHYYKTHKQHLFSWKGVSKPEWLK